MQCKKCKAEWTPGSVKSQLSVCPFCGALLVSAPVPDDDLTMPDVMVRIVEQFGEEILSQERKCIAAFKDFAPKLEKEQKILKIAFGESVYKFFLGCPLAERESRMQKARQSMSVLLSDEASLMVVNSFAVALGWDISSAEQGHISLKETNNGNNKLNQNIKGSEEKTEALNNQEDDEDYLSPYDDPSYTSAIVSPQNQAVEQGDQMLQKGNEAYRARDYHTALLWYQQAADAGNAEGIAKIGEMYYLGIQVEKNYDEALKWYRKAVDAGSVVQQSIWLSTIEDIQNRLRRHKEEDLINEARTYLEKDSYEKALQLFHEAADAGDGEAMFWIGWMYKEGKGG